MCRAGCNDPPTGPCDHIWAGGGGTILGIMRGGGRACMVVLLGSMAGGKPEHAMSILVHVAFRAPFLNIVIMGNKDSALRSGKNNLD